VANTAVRVNTQLDALNLILRSFILVVLILTNQIVDYLCCQWSYDGHVPTAPGSL